MELAMARVISGLSDSAMSHSIICLKEEPKILDRLPASVEIRCMHARPNELALPFRLAKALRELKPDVIHARNWGAWPDTAFARLLVWPLIPFIFSFHGLGKAGYMPLRRRLASKFLVKISTHLLTVSRQSRSMLSQHWGWPEARTLVIPNGVDTDKFYPFETPRNKRFIVGTVGNLRTVKNHALILKACAGLAAAGLDLEIRIAGEGDQRQPLVELAASLGLADRLLLPGKIEAVPEFLNALDLFVLSSDSEQHPNALNEAMACGIASVGTRVGCVEDLLDGGRCGIIIEPGDETALATAISALAQNQTLRRQYAEAGLQHVRDNYSLSVMLGRYRELYCRAAGKKRKH